MKIRFVGDHSKYHCGSAAAADVIKKEILRHGEIVKDNSYDVLVVNGEGSMHHDSPAFRKKMNEIERASERKKAIFLINTVWQSNPKSSFDLLRRCEQIVVREVLSQEELRKESVFSEVIPDQSYFAEVRESDYIDFNGSIVFTDFWSMEFQSFVRVNSKWAQKFSYIDMQAMTWSQLVRSLRTCSLLVTGRHHAVYAACKAEIPFVALRGNTHKIEGLFYTSKVNMPIIDKFEDIKNLITGDYIYNVECEEIFHWIGRQSPWRMQ